MPLRLRSLTSSCRTATARPPRSLEPLAALGALAMAAGCVGAGRGAAAPVAAPSAVRSLVPGSRDLELQLSVLDVDGAGDGVVFALFRDGGGTRSAGAAIATVTERAAAFGAAAGRALVTSAWSAPYESYDSLTIDRATLAPIAETVTSGRARYEYRYDGRRVVGKATVDSGVVAVDRSFPGPVFAFNEVELLVRSLRYRAGDVFVVPLFSEADRAVEHDTLRVERREVVNGAPMWAVDFADPVITTRYRIDGASRRIVDAVTVQRKSGTTFRLLLRNSVRQ
jgi:hypothetical protein